jgi:hypothetical protein
MDEILTTTSPKNKLLGTINDEHCQEWTIKYNKAYDIIKNLPQQEEKENDKWKKEILDILKNDKISLWLWEDDEVSSILDILRMNYNKKN